MRVGKGNGYNRACAEIAMPTKMARDWVCRFKIWNIKFAK